MFHKKAISVMLLGLNLAFGSIPASHATDEMTSVDASIIHDQCIQMCENPDLGRICIVFIYKVASENIIFGLEERMHRLPEEFQKELIEIFNKNPKLWVSYLKFFENCTKNKEHYESYKINNPKLRRCTWR